MSEDLCVKKCMKPFRKASKNASLIAWISESKNGHFIGQPELAFLDDIISGSENESTPPFSILVIRPYNICTVPFRRDPKSTEFSRGGHENVRFPNLN